MDGKADEALGRLLSSAEPAVRLLARRDSTEAKWASRFIDRPFTILGLT